MTMIMIMAVVMEAPFSRRMVHCWHKLHIKSCMCSW